MRFLAYLLTLFLVGTAVAQNPTILQGNYITNVFGNSNFVLNPNAQTNVLNVTVSSATVTRSTSTPLVATSEFLVTTSTATGSATWSTRTFDGGMKGQNCEARFTYRGFSVGSTTAQILQGANVVAQLTLTSTTDPRIASINFPCGDLSSATTFRLQQATASLTGTNEIGGIYVGLATNMANVAQAEFVGSLKVTGCSSSYSTPSNTPSYSTAWSFSPPTGCIYTATGNLDAPTNTAKPGFKLKNDKAGTYFVTVQGTVGVGAPTSGGGNGSIRIENGSVQSSETYFGDSTTSASLYPGGFQATIAYSTIGDPLFYFSAKTQINNTLSVYGTNTYPLYISVYRFPSSSELVVKPETQNVFGGVRYDRSTSSISVGGGAAAPTGFNTFSSSAWNTGKSYFGKCQATDIDANRIGCKIPAMPVGSYKITATGLFYEASANTGDIICSHAISETTTGTYISYTTNKYNTASGGVIYNGRTITGIFQNTSVADRNFVLSANKTFDSSSGAVGTCQVFVSNSGGDQSNFNIVIEPLDQPSNSALYVQGPVLGAQTGAAIPSGYLGKVEFGGGNGSTSASPANVYTISNVTPGVYLVRGYAAAQATGARSATYAGYGCTITSNASLALNWYDFLNVPQTNFGASGGTFTGYALSNNYANSSASIMQIINVTSTSTYYVRCAIDSNGSGILLVAGAEFIRLN